MKHLFILLIAFLIASSCSKVEPKILEPYIGDYDWSYSELSSTTFLTPTDTPDRYGFRITEKGKVILFKNGTQISKHKITRVYTSFGTQQIDYKTGRNQTATIRFNATMENAYPNNFPFSEVHNNESNIFLKIN